MVWSQAREIIANLRRLDVMNGLLQLPQQQQQQPVTRLRGRGKGDSCPRRVQQARGRKTASPQIFYDQRTQKTDGHFCDAPSVSEFFFLARAPAGVWRGAQFIASAPRAENPSYATGSRSPADVSSIPSVTSTAPRVDTIRPFISPILVDATAAASTKRIGRRMKKRAGLSYNPRRPNDF